MKFNPVSAIFEYEGKQIDLDKRPVDYNLQDKKTISIKPISIQFGVQLPGKVQQFKMKPHLKIGSLSKHLPTGTKLALRGKPLNVTQSILDAGVQEGDILECL